MHRIRAFLGGYFWLSCPICKRKFGGHEQKSGNVLWTGYHVGIGICNDPECKKIADKRNEEFLNKHKEVLTADNKGNIQSSYSKA